MKHKPYRLNDGKWSCYECRDVFTSRPGKSDCHGHERGLTPFAPDNSGRVLTQAEPAKEVLSPVESKPL